MTYVVEDIVVAKPGEKIATDGIIYMVNHQWMNQ